MTSGALGGMKAIRIAPKLTLRDLSSSATLECRIITSLKEEDEFLLSFAEEKIKLRVGEIERRGSALLNIFDKWGALLPVSAVVLASTVNLQKLVTAVFGFNLAQLGATALLALFFSLLLTRGHVSALNRAVFVLQQAQRIRQQKRESEALPDGNAAGAVLTAAQSLTTADALPN